MADKKECEVCRKATAEKYKYYKLWKILAILFMCLTIVLAILYFGSGEVFKETINNDVEIVNTGGSNNNNNNVVINN